MFTDEGPLDFLHVRTPDAAPGSASPDDGDGKGEDVSKKDYPIDEAKCSERHSDPNENG